MAELSDMLHDADSEETIDRRSFLGDLTAAAAGAIALALPDISEAAQRYNVSYGLVKDDAGLAQLKQKYQSLMATSLKSELTGKLVIEKTSHGNYALVFAVGKDKKAAFRIAKRHKDVSGIDASIRKVCGCEVVYPGAGHAQKPVLRPKTAPVVDKSHTKPADDDDSTLDEPKPAPVAKAKPPVQANIPSRITNDPNYVQYSALTFDNLEDTLVRQQSLEARNGNLSSRDMVLCYVYDRSSGNMPVLLHSDRRIPALGNAVARLGKEVITGKERLSNNTAEGIGDFINLIHDYASLDRKKNKTYVLPRKGILTATLPGDVRSLSEKVEAGRLVGEASVILAEEKTSMGKHYHTYIMVMAIQGRDAASKEKYPAVMGRFSRLVYEAMRSRYPLI